MEIYIVWYDNGEFGEKNIVIDSAWSNVKEAEKRKNFLWGMYADVTEVDLDNMEMKRTEFTGMNKKLPSVIFPFSLENNKNEHDSNNNWGN